jgi:hypothetical protein
LLITRVKFTLFGGKKNFIFIFTKKIYLESDKSRKTELNPDQNGQPNQYAPSMRGPAMPFGYPSNLNQYGQPYDPYGQYAAYHKTEPMMAQPYVVNTVYPPMGYPVIVPGTTGENSQQQQQNQQQAQQQQQQQHPYQHYNMMQQHSPQTARPPMMQNEHVMHQQSPSGSPQVYYQQQQQHSQPPSQRSSPHLNDVKHEQHNEGFVKPQPMTPVPSTSTSTATTSSPDSGNLIIK